MGEITLWGTKLSGHTHRVELLLRALGLAYQFVDMPRPARGAPEFLAMNKLGQVPVLRDGDVVEMDGAAGTIRRLSA